MGITFGAQQITRDQVTADYTRTQHQQYLGKIGNGIMSQDSTKGQDQAYHPANDQGPEP
tara:strand:- start:1 stop:177 length:177 start_codon:yes stop_codon:yes gene_type:complete